MLHFWNITPVINKGPLHYIYKHNFHEEHVCVTIHLEEMVKIHEMNLERK